MAMVYMQELCFWRVYVSCPLAWIYLLVFSALDSSHILFYRQLNSLAGDKMKIRPRVYVICPLAWIYLLVFSALDSSHILFYRQLNSLAGDKMKIRPKRHHKTATNPIKNLQQRTDVRTDTEVHFTVLFILKLCLGISVH